MIDSYISCDTFFVCWLNFIKNYKSVIISKTYLISEIYNF